MFSIGQLSARTGVKVPTIRYYEQIGLLASDGRTSGNQRRYDHSGLERLTFIRHARDLGLPLEAIRTLIDLDGQDHTPAHDIAATHLADIRHRITALRRLEAELKRITCTCDGNGNAPCQILNAFGDHSLCDTAHN